MLKVGAVFYPQSLVDRDRCGQAALPFGWNEPLMVRYARPLFTGHDQPRCYAIDRLGQITMWDDSVEAHVQLQCDLAVGYGLDYFLVDTYAGATQGQIVHELSQAPLGHLARASTSIEYAIMAVLERPRVMLPFSGVVSRSEADREYDLSGLTAGAIVDAAAPHWASPRYLRYEGQPCLWVFPGARQARDPRFVSLVAEIRERSLRATGLAPYIIATARRRADVTALAAAGPDAVTGYAYLPTFGRGAPPLQSYEERLIAVESDWHALARCSDLPWLPPAVVGWDASPRGCPTLTWPEASRRRVYPYVPIIYDASAELFGSMLRKCGRYIGSNPGPPFLSITAWNEIGEGCALLPRVLPDGRLDDSYLRQVQAFKKAAWPRHRTADAPVQAKGATDGARSSPDASFQRTLSEAYAALSARSVDR